MVRGIQSEGRKVSFRLALALSTAIAIAPFHAMAQNVYPSNDAKLPGFVPGVAPVYSYNPATSAQIVTISNASPAVVSWPAHGLSVNQEVVFTNSGGALNTGLTAGTIYYVIAAGLTTGAFEVSATVGGSAVNTSSAGSGTQTATAQSEQYISATQLASATNLAVPPGANIAEICVETAGVRYRERGNVPTASIGMPVVGTSSASACFPYAGPLTTIEFILISGSPTMDVFYYNNGPRPASGG